MFNGLLKTEFSDLFQQDFEGVKTFDLDKRQEFKVTDNFLDEDEEKDDFTNIRKGPEMLYEDEL